MTVVRVTERELHGRQTVSWADRSSFEAFVREHGAGLVRLATLLLGDGSYAEDVVQESLIAAGSRWTAIRPDTAPAYVKKIVSNKAIDHMRRQRELLLEVIPETSFVDANFLRYEEDRAFFQRLHVIQGRQRAILVLRYYADMSDADIAKLLNCTRVTVRTQASRALAKLRQLMESES